MFYSNFSCLRIPGTAQQLKYMDFGVFGFACFFLPFTRKTHLISKKILVQTFVAYAHRKLQALNIQLDNYEIKSF